MKTIFKIIMIVIFIGWIGTLSEKKSGQNHYSNALVESAIASEPSNTWDYSSSEDSMTGKKTYHASVISANEVNFAFPYNGSQHATLTLRTHPQHGKDLILSIERGQFLCNSYSGCGVLIRFDEGVAVKYAATEPSDHSTTTVFINNYSNFASHMLKAKKVKIQAEFYQEGNHVFEFDVSGFDTKKYRPN